MSTFAKLFTAWVIVVCSLVAYANMTGWRIIGGSANKWDPAGQSARSGFNHK